MDVTKLNAADLERLKSLVELCKETLADVEEDGRCDDDADHYIFEAAMEFVFGSDIWSRYNAALR